MLMVDPPEAYAEKLLHERRSEFGFENQRWHDLKRFGIAIQVMNAHLAPQGIITRKDIIARHKSIMR
jgi:hypothetical protein